jgi:hypothetical protein
MNDYGVHRVNLNGHWIYKRVGENSVASVLDKLTVKPVSRKAAKGATKLELAA